ncbi:MAG: hypothetical protein ACRD1X_12395 [Vicinamibacteria bacterium]
MAGRFKFKGGKAVGSLHLSAQPSDGDFFTIGGKKYEFDNNASVGAGSVTVTIGGSAALTMTALIAAINANKPTIPVTAVVDPVNATGQTCRLTADRVGSNGNLALTKSGANLVLSAAAMAGGENGSIQTVARGAHTVDANDVQADAVIIETGLTSPRFAEVVCRDSAGLLKAITALVTVVGSTIKVAFAGATDPAATDVLTWSSWE